MTIPTRRHLRALMLLAAMVVALAVQLPGAPRADAALWNVMPSDSFGAPQNVFFADDALFFSGTSDIDGGWVCIVHASVTDPAAASCDSSAWGKEKRMLGLGTLLGMPVAAPMLKIGQWRLLTADPSTKKGVELSDVFTVQPCRGTCDTAPAQAIIDQWKIVAGSKSFSNGVGCYLGNVKAITNAFNAARGMYALAGGGLMGFMLGGAWGYFGFANDITTEDMALSLFRDVSCGASLMFAGIADDPPDSNFGTVADPVIRTLPLTGDAAYDDLFDAYERASGYGTASRVAFERYQGAMAASNDAAAAMQAQAASDFTVGLIQALRDIDRLQPAVEAKPVMAGPTADAATVQAADDFANRVASTGFTVDEIADMQAHGLDASEIDSVRASVAGNVTNPGYGLDTSTIDPTMSMRTVLEGTRADMPATIEAFDHFSRSMNVVAAELDATLPPAPVAHGQAITTYEDQPVSVTLTGSASGGAAITFAVTGGPAHGSLGGTAPNLTYTPDAGYLGTDSFSFTVNDGTRTSMPATVHLEVVEKVNQPPTATAQTVNGFQDEVSSIMLAGSDPDGDPLTYTLTGNPAHGSLGGTEPNVTYTPDAGFTGSDSFTFVVSDGSATSAPATVSIEVAENRPPTARDYTVKVVPGIAKTFNVYGSDPDRRPITYAVADQPDHGTLISDSTNRSWTFTPSDSFPDTDSLTYTVSDGVHTSAPATVTFILESANANDDVLTVQGAQIIDVTQNDSPMGAAVGDVTAPEHGTVSCSAFGMCLYVADNGYVGDDSFDYTLQVGSNESTATVAVTVEAPPVVAVGKPQATDDVLQTPAGTSGVVDVLANDSGDGTLAATPSDGEHGTVSCEPDGTCTYTPTDADFVGFDMFSYTLDNGTDVDTGLVRVRVGDTPTGLGVLGGTAGWALQHVNDGPVETGPSRTAPVVATPSGPHSYVPGSARAADGWTLATSGDEITATPGSDALIGDQATSMLPRPLPPISQGTGGDGHVPILVGTKAYAFFHHQNPTQISCVDRATGQLCPNYPRTVPVGTRNNPGPGAVVGTQIWVHLYAHNYKTSGLYCWDTATDQTCGMVTNRPGTPVWDGTAPLLVEGKLWFATVDGNLRCVDPTTTAPCTGEPIETGIGFTYDYGDIVNHGTKVYVSNFADANCVDVATGEQCAGWPEGGRSLQGNLVRSHDGTTGAVNGVCGVNVTMNCVRDDDPATVDTIDVRWWYTDYTYSASVEAEAGTRTFWGSNSTTGLGCFDWATMSLCTGPAFDARGFVHKDIGGNSLYRVYGTVWDGSCAVALGDPGQMFTMDFEGNSPCSSLDSGAAPLKIDLRRQRFDNAVGNATWDRVRVLGTDLGAGTNFTSFVVTIRDAASGATVASQEMIDTNGILDLSAIDASEHPSLTVSATSRSVDGGEAWADGQTPKVQLDWNADAAPLGFMTVTPACLDDSPDTVSVKSTSGDQTARGEQSIVPLPPCTPPTTTTTTTTPGTTIPGTTVPGTMPQTPTHPGEPEEPGLVVNQSQGGPGQPTPVAAEPPVFEDSSLARTGSDARRLALFGGLALLGGAVVVAASRRRFTQR